MAREVASWRSDGWEPTGDFAEDVLSAYECSRAGAPSALVESLLEDVGRLYGADVVAQAFRLVHAEMEAWRADEVRRR